MKRTRLLLLGLVLVVCSIPIGPRHAALAHNAVASRRILFIGNSYTYFNNLPRLVAGMAESAHESLETEMVVVGGATLKKHWEDGKAAAAIKRGGWDYVVLQEQSLLGSPLQAVPRVNDPKMFHEYARLFDAEIKKVKARTVFFMTWARRNLPETQDLLVDAYESIAKELHAIVVPVGLAWQAALKRNPNLVLHQLDMSHPTPAGSYLAACVFYSTLYDKTSLGLTSRIIGRPIDVAGRVQGGSDASGSGAGSELVNVGKPDAELLQRVAWQAVEDEKRRAR